MAHALQTRILPQVQYMIDVHSGGASLRYLPATVITRYGDDPWDERVARLARGFGLARCLFFRGVETGSMPAAASRLGVARLSAEIGGGAETSQELVRLCRDGMLSCLAGLDMVDAHHAMPGPLEAFHDVDAPGPACGPMRPASSSRRSRWDNRSPPASKSARCANRPGPIGRR